MECYKWKSGLRSGTSIYPRVGDEEKTRTTTNETINADNEQRRKRIKACIWVPFFSSCIVSLAHLSPDKKKAASTTTTQGPKQEHKIPYVKCQVNRHLNMYMKLSTIEK